MKLATVLKHLEVLETKVSEVYNRFGKLFQDDDEASKFFNEMSKDELSHRDLVAFQSRLVRKSPLLFEDVDIDMDEIFALLSRIDEILKQELKPALEEAINISLEIENNAAEFHFREIMKISNRDIAKMIRNLGKSDKAHRKQITDFANKRGIIYILEETS